MRSLVLIDAKNLLFRSHFSHEQLNDSQGRPTGALYGFMQTIVSLKRKLSPCRVVVCWEGGVLPEPEGAPPVVLPEEPIPAPVRKKEPVAEKGKRVSEPKPEWEHVPSWRHLLAAEFYKQDRPRDNRYLRAIMQIQPLVTMLDWAGYRQVELPGCEADDLIGLLAWQRHQTKPEQTVLVYSNDRDLWQLLALPSVRIVVPLVRQAKPYRIVDRATMEKETSVSPVDWPRYRAMAGDPSDNIKALPGVGPQTALKLLKAGLDPRVPVFTALPKKVQQEFSKYAEHWEKLHVCYKISLIPRQVEDIPHIGRQWAARLTRDLALAGKPWKPKTETWERERGLVGMFAEYELNSLIGAVGKILV